MYRSGKITFGSSLSVIKDRAFLGCTGLKTATSLAITPPSAESKTFNGVPVGTPLYVPKGSEEAYQTAKNWEVFFIKSMDNTLTGDVNGDGEVTIADINIIIDAILSGTFNNGCDVNGDGEVTIADVNMIINIILNA